MTIIDTLKKFLNMNKFKGEQYEKISADEMELQSYLNEERRDELRKLLAYYRIKKNKEILIGNTFADQAREIHGNKGILETDNVFNKRDNMFAQKNTILCGDNPYQLKKKKFKEISMWRWIMKNKKVRLNTKIKKILEGRIGGKGKVNLKGLNRNIKVKRSTAPNRIW